MSATPKPEPLRKRRYHTFLSHAHVDIDAVQQFRNWLASAGIDVWYDAEQVPAGSQFPDQLSYGISQCQSLIVAASAAAVESNWVNTEINLGYAHSNDYKPFPVIPVKLEECSLPSMLMAHSSVTGFLAAGGRLSGLEASRLLASIHSLPDATPPVEATRQIIQMISREAGEPPSAIEQSRCPALFVTFGWSDKRNEPILRKGICKVLSGFCLTGDAIDHPHSDWKRVAAIMDGCAAHVIAVPMRGTGLIDHPDYKSLRSEILTGQEAGLPQHFILEKGVDPWQFDTAESLIEVKPEKPEDESWTAALYPWTDQLHRTIRNDRPPHYVFVATDYEDRVFKEHVVRHVSKITGLPCLKGSDFSGKMPSRKIECAIRGASLVIANIVSSTGKNGKPVINWNTCIEAGMALGAGKPVQILARRKANRNGEKADSWTIHESLPFMIRDNSISTYSDDSDLIALIHKFCRPFRRRVLTSSGPV